MFKDKNSKIAAVIQLSQNDIKSKYSNSLFGIVWAFVMPLVTILVFWYVFQMGFRNPPVENAPYIFWFSAAYIPWIFFTDMLTSGCNSLVEYSFLVKKIKFDVSVIPIIKIISALFVHLFFVIFLFGMSMIYDYGMSIYCVQVIYYLIALCAFTYGAVMLLAAITVFFKDIISVVNVMIQIGFWITPILWNENTMINVSVRNVLSINPMHYIINGYRDCYIYRKWFWENPIETLFFWGVTIFLILLGRIVFRKLSPFFADEV